MSIQTAVAVRPARPGDHAAVRALVARQAGVAPGRGTYTRRHHAENLATFGDGFLVATVAGVVVGHAGVRHGPRADEATVAELYVLPEYRGHGVLDALWDAATKHAWALWTNTLCVTVLSTDAAMRRFVAQRGAVAVRTLTSPGGAFGVLYRLALEESMFEHGLDEYILPGRRVVAPSPTDRTITRFGPLALPEVPVPAAWRVGTTPGVYIQSGGQTGDGRPIIDGQ